MQKETRMKAITLLRKYSAFSHVLDEHGNADVVANENIFEENGEFFRKVEGEVVSSRAKRQEWHAPSWAIPTQIQTTKEDSHE